MGASRRFLYGKNFYVSVDESGATAAVRATAAFLECRADDGWVGSASTSD